MDPGFDLRLGLVGGKRHIISGSRTDGRENGVLLFSKYNHWKGYRNLFERVQNNTLLRVCLESLDDGS